MEIIEVSSSSVVPGDRDSPQHSQWLQKTLSVVEATSREQLALGTWQVENLEISDSYPQFVVEDPEIKCDSANFDVEYLDKLVDELMLTEECKMKLKEKREIGENQMDKRGRDFFQVESIRTNMNDYGEVQATARDFSEGSGYEWDNTWCELRFQITNLMEENLQQQTELARRNIEKKLVIDKLRLQLEHVKAENRSLQNCISCLKVGEKRKSLQIRGLLSGKFFGGGCT